MWPLLCFLGKSEDPGAHSAGSPGNWKAICIVVAVILTISATAGFVIYLALTGAPIPPPVPVDGVTVVDSSTARFNGSDYAVEKRPYTFGLCRLLCLDTDSDVTDILSEKENDFVYDLVSRAGNQGDVWLGFVKHRGFRWRMLSNMRLPVYTNWNMDTGKARGAEVIAMMNTNKNSTGFKRWETVDYLDLDAIKKGVCVCKKPIGTL